MMKINFDEGIQILIDDNKIIEWDQIDDKKIKITIESGNQVINYLIDLRKKEVKTEK